MLLIKDEEGGARAEDAIGGCENSSLFSGWDGHGRERGKTSMDVSVFGKLKVGG